MKHRIIKLTLVIASIALLLMLFATSFVTTNTAEAAKPPTRTPRPTATPAPPTFTPTPAPPTPTPTPSAGLTCPTSATLESLVTCIVSHFGPFVIPNATQETDFRTMVRNMLNAQCNFAAPGTLAGIYQVRTFTDSGNGKNYCLAIEIQDANGNGQVDKGWGTFIVNNSPSRELNHAAAHPVDDISTQDQAISLFKSTNSRSYLLAGATRNLGVSNCQDSIGYAASDAAHNVDIMFFQATVEINSWYGTTPWWQLQWHGMAVDSCSTNVYVTHAIDQAPAPTDKLYILKQKVLQYNPTWVVTVPGDSPSCSLTATTNVEGRFLDGVPITSCCSTAATSFTEKFFSIEQDPNMRNPSNWLQAVLDTFP